MLFLFGLRPTAGGIAVCVGFALTEALRVHVVVPRVPFANSKQMFFSPLCEVRNGSDVTR